MANEFDDLRALLSQKALTFAGNVALPIKMPNAPFDDPAGPWLEYGMKLGKTGQAELGGPAALEITVGIIQFDVIVPEMTGDGVAMSAANQIKKKINRKEWLVGSTSYVKLDAAEITNGLPTKAGWYRVCVDATFLFFHRDPDADPLKDF